jgi:hypothetical protein
MSSSSTSSSDAARRFVWKFLLLALPFLAWLGFPVFVLWVSGELTVPLDAVVARQKNPADPVLFGQAYSNTYKPFKLRSTQQRAPAILALGSSIVMQFRAGFFREPETFYNAGGAVALAWEFGEFLKEIPEERSPSVILLGLDQCQFNRAWQPALFLSRTSPYRDYREANSLRLIQDNWLPVYKAYGDGKFSMACLAGRPGVGTVGLRALAEGGGFRNDGSQCFGTIKHLGAAHPACWDYRFKVTFDRVEHNGDRFEYAERISPERVALFLPFLDECRRRKIHVVAFVPPLAPSVWQRMTAKGPKYYGYISQIVPVVGPLLAERGYTLHDFSDAAALGATDAEFLDGYHCGERVNLRMQIVLARDDPVYGALVDRMALERLLRDTRGPCSVFDD